MITHSEIECFLAICRYKTITLAAENLFITQPSLSSRLKSLEKELNCTLFDRRKGQREIVLTPSGKAFYELAVQYESLFKQMMNVAKQPSDTLRVSAFNSISECFLPTVYRRFMEEHPDYHLEIQDMDLGAAVESIWSGETDLAFAAGKTTKQPLFQAPAFREEMVLVVGDKLKFTKQRVSVEDLTIGKEIYIKWSNLYHAWHRQTFRYDYPQMTVSIMTQLKQLMHQGDYWAIVPISISKQIFDNTVRIVDTDFDIPNREIYVVTSADEHSEIIKEFLESIKKVAQESPDLYLLMDA